MIVGNCYMEEENVMNHLPDKDPDYRKFKDDQREINLQPGSRFRQILDECRRGQVKKVVFDYNDYDFEFYSHIKEK